MFEPHARASSRKSQHKKVTQPRANNAPHRGRCADTWAGLSRPRDAPRADPTRKRGPVHAARRRAAPTTPARRSKPPSAEDRQIWRRMGRSGRPRTPPRTTTRARVCGTWTSALARNPANAFATSTTSARTRIRKRTRTRTARTARITRAGGGGGAIDATETRTTRRSARRKSPRATAATASPTTHPRTPP